jgi:hypothetical protein
MHHRPEGNTMPQYAVLIYTDDSAHRTAPEQPGQPGQPEQPDKSDKAGGEREHDEHADALAASGSMLAAYALTPRDLATSIRADGMTDGPFIESKEIVAGFYVLDAPDLDAALALAATNPAIAAGGGVEVRPIHSGGPAAPTDSDA